MTLPSAAPPGLDVALLRESFAEIAAHGHAIPEHFYGQLFARYPHLRRRFPVGMTGQNDRLVRAIVHVVTNLDRPDQLTAYLTALGADHRKFEVSAEDYPAVGDALLHTLCYFSGPRWTPQRQDAWTAAYTLIAQVMTAGAARAEQAGLPPWWDATVTDLNLITPDLAVLTVVPDLPYPWTAGQSVPLTTNARANVWRNYCPANRPGSYLDGRLVFHVRVVPGGVLSRALAYRLRPATADLPGDRVRLGPPAGRSLTLDGWDGVRPLLLLAGGTGLAPLRAIIEEITAAEADGRLTPPQVILVVGARTPRDLYAWDDLTRLAQGRQHWLHILPAVDGPNPGEAAVQGIPTGYPADVAATRLGGRLAGYEVYVCGPERMIGPTLATLATHGVPAEVIHVEDYTAVEYAPAPTVTPAPAAAPTVVTHRIPDPSEVSA